MKNIIPLIIAIFILNIACSKSHGGNPEFFDDENRPYFVFDDVKNQYILEPWNYNFSKNAKRKYPLVIYLHGSGGAGNISYLSHIGYDNPEDENVNETAYNFQKEHPCFTLVPQTSSGWNNTSLIEQVEEFKNIYRIDEKRIYLIGYSMGGSGSYSFANAYNDYNGHLFTGIIRLAGQSQTSVRDDIADKTCIWIHIGLNDTEQRVQVTREAYEFWQNYHENEVETETPVNIEGYEGTTYTMSIDNDDRFKRTEYVGVGHGVASFPFKDPYLIEWLFKHEL